MKVHFVPNGIYVEDIDRDGSSIGELYNHFMLLLQKVEESA